VFSRELRTFLWRRREKIREVVWTTGRRPEPYNYRTSMPAGRPLCLLFFFCVFAQYLWTVKDTSATAQVQGMEDRGVVAKGRRRGHCSQGRRRDAWLTSTWHAVAHSGASKSCRRASASHARNSRKGWRRSSTASPKSSHGPEREGAREASGHEERSRKLLEERATKPVSAGPWGADPLWLLRPRTQHPPSPSRFAMHLREAFGSQAPRRSPSAQVVAASIRRRTAEWMM